MDIFIFLLVKSGNVEWSINSYDEKSNYIAYLIIFFILNEGKGLKILQKIKNNLCTKAICCFEMFPIR